MAKVKHNQAFHIRLKCQPKLPYKHFYMKGVVVAKSEAQAKEKALSETKEWAEKVEGFENITVTIIEVTKLRTDFLMSA